MPYCTNCGEEVTDEQRYCSYCGEPVGDHAGRGRGRDRSVGDGRQDTGGGTDQPRQVPDPQSRDTWSAADASETGGFEGDPPPDGYEDPPSIREPGPRARSGPGTIGLFSSSLREVFGVPVALGGLFAAWFAVSSLVLLPAAAQLPGLILSGLVGLLSAGVIYATVDGELRGRPVAVGDALSRVTSQFLPLVVVWLLFVPVFLVGFSFFILPGLYLGGRLLLAFPACVLDGRGAIDSLSTSWRRTRGVGLTAMGVLALALVTFFALALILAIPQNLVFSALGIDVAGFETLEEALELLDDPQVTLVSSFFQALALSIPVGAVQVAAVRLYRRGDEDASQTSEPY
ncbi:MAG: zinc ribbon domain-containing protein [Natrialbaceae archaeon]